MINAIDARQITNRQYKEDYEKIKRLVDLEIRKTAENFNSRVSIIRPSNKRVFDLLKRDLMLNGYKIEEPLNSVSFFITWED